MEPTDTNLRAWEEAHKRIRRSSARGSRTLPKPVRERLPDIGGRHVLHLACGAGRETAALMSLGALVTGVDASEETVVAARKRLPDAALVAACLDQMLRWHESYFDAWPLGRLIHAFGGAGLALERLEELPDPNRWGRREVRVPGDL